MEDSELAARLSLTAPVGAIVRTGAAGVLIEIPDHACSSPMAAGALLDSWFRRAGLVETAGLHSMIFESFKLRFRIGSGSDGSVANLVVVGLAGDPDVFYRTETWVTAAIAWGD